MAIYLSEDAPSYNELCTVVSLQAIKSPPALVFPVEVPDIVKQKRAIFYDDDDVQLASI